MDLNPNMYYHSGLKSNANEVVLHILQPSELQPHYQMLLMLYSVHYFSQVNVNLMLERWAD